MPAPNDAKLQEQLQGFLAAFAVRIQKAEAEAAQSGNKLKPPRSSMAITDAELAGVVSKATHALQ